MEAVANVLAEGSGGRCSARQVAATEEAGCGAHAAAQPQLPTLAKSNTNSDKNTQA